MSMHLAARGKANSEINVTPLIDVLLVLLIIFMVVVPHRREGESAEIPKQITEPTTSLPPEDSIVVQVLSARDGGIPTLKINQDSVGWDTLDARLSDIFRGRSQRVAFLKSDPDVPFQHVAEALDIARHAGADRVGLMDVDSRPTYDVEAAEPRR